MNLIYYMSLLFILFFIIFLIDKDRNKAPKKIRIFLGLSLIVLFIKNLALIFMCIIKNIEIIYVLKNFIYLDYLIIPVIILNLYYIYLRFDNINFNRIYGITTIMFFIYLIFIYKIEGTIKLDASLGYFIVLKNENIIKDILIFIIGILLLGGAVFLDKPNSNKTGIIIIMTVLGFMIIENMLIMFKVWIFPYCIISEILLLFVINNSLNTFNKI